MFTKISSGLWPATILAAVSGLAGANTAISADPIANVGKSPAQVIGVYVFGKKNQTEAVQLADEQRCFNSAKTASNYDQAMADATAPAQPVERPRGGRVRGAVGGAVVGTAIGAAAGDSGKGAAIGATAGVLSGGAQQREARRTQAAQAVQAQEQKKATAVAELKRAFGACMEARDYSVK